MVCIKYIMNLMRSIEPALTDIHTGLRESFKLCLLQRQSPLNAAYNALLLELLFKGSIYTGSYGFKYFLPNHLK